MASSWLQQDRVTKGFLSRFTIADIISSDQRLTFVDQSATVEQAMQLMRKHKVLSLPIWDNSKKEFIGMVNIYDLVTAICFQNLFTMDQEMLSGITPQDLQQAQNRAVFQQPVVSCLGISEESKNFAIVESTDKLTKAIHLFSLGNHRLLVHFVGGSALSQDESSTKSYYRIISQTDVVRFLHINTQSPELNPLTLRSIVASGLVASAVPSRMSAAVLSVPKSSTALSAFREMSFRKVSAAAVVDEESNRLLTTISTSDLRGMTQETFHYLLFNVLDFLRHTRGQHKEVVACVPEDTVGSAIEKALMGGVHRVWVVNDEKSRQPTGVISLTDLIALFQT